MVKKLENKNSEEKFGSIVYDGKMINLDSEDVENLSKISTDITKKYNTLMKKTLTVFNQ